MWLLLACDAERTPRPKDDPEVVVVACNSGEVPSDGACVPAACGTERFPEADGDVVYVLAGEEGDGSEEAPFGTLEEAIGPDRTVLLGSMPGGASYESVPLDGDHDGLTILGRCRELVNVGGEGFVIVGGAEKSWAISNLTIADTDGIGVWVTRGRLTLDRVDIFRATLAGIVAEDTDSTLRSVTIADIAPDGGSYGYGFELYGGTLDADGLAISNATAFGLFATGGTQMVARSLSITGTQGGRSAPGYGIAVQEDSAASLTGCVISNNAAYGVLLGLDATQRASASLTDCTVEGNALAGVYATGRVTLDVVGGRFADTVPIEGSPTGNGMGIADGASVTISGATLAGNKGSALAAFGTGTEVLVEDSLMEDNAFVGAWAIDGAHLSILGGSITRTASLNGEGGHGVAAHRGGVLTMEDTILDDQASVGIYVGAGSEISVATLTNITVRGTDESLDGHGYGIYAGPSGEVTVTDALVEDNVSAGIIAHGGTIVVTGGSVTGTRRSLLSEYQMAAGLGAVGGGRITAEGVSVLDTDGLGALADLGSELTCVECILSGNTYAGVIATGGVLTMEGGSISGTQSDQGLGGGFGVVVTDRTGEATVGLTDVDITANLLGGLYTTGGVVTVSGGIIEGSEPVDLGTVHVFGQSVLGVGTDGVALDGVRISDAGGTAILLDASTADLADITWTNVGGTYPADAALVQQDCGDLAPMDPGSAPSARICVTPDMIVGVVTPFTGTLSEAVAAE